MAGGDGPAASSPSRPLTPDWQQTPSCSRVSNRLRPGLCHHSFTGWAATKFGPVGGTGKITVYGAAPSRTYRCLWLLEELGLECERELIRSDDDAAKRSAYLELNPNGRVPCLVDGDPVLFESLAINLYLMRRYGGRSFENRPIQEDERVVALGSA